MKGSLVMLLTNLESCRIGDCNEVGGEVGRPYLVVRRGRREGAEDDFGREASSAHDIGVLGVVGVVACEVIAEVGKVGEAGGVTGGVASDVAEVAAGLFACFVRTWSCSLVLLGNLAGQRLHEKASAFSFAIRAFSTRCCLYSSIVDM